MDFGKFRKVSNEILDRLDPEQLAVATTFDKPVVVLAGAGTGKTRAITHRVAHAISTGRYRGSQVLAVTFTTRAAGEMRLRLARLGIFGAQARTIHSAALRQCQYFWPEIYGSEFPELEANTFSAIARCVTKIVGEANTNLIRDVQTEISWAKSSNVSAENYSEVAADRSVEGISPSQLAVIMAAYEKDKAARAVVDFDDVLLCAVALLSSREEVATRIRDQYRHFVVDEYQDISGIQHRLISLWVDGRTDHCIVGDPNQTIYSYAGADKSYLLDAATDPRNQVIRLTRNYRSTPEILRIGNKVLNDSSLRATRRAGSRPELVAASSPNAEAREVAAWLKQGYSSGSHWEDMAVLYRINAQSPPLEAALEDEGIPYTIRGSERFYERREVKRAVEIIRREINRDPESTATELLARMLKALGWRKDAPSSQGAQREAWESIHALKEMFDEQISQNPKWRAQEMASWLRERISWDAAPQPDAVTLSTIHAAKGLEWGRVAIVGIREGFFPLSLATGSEALAEERRILYVGCTRAKDELRLSWHLYSHGAKQERSAFLQGVSESRKEHNPGSAEAQPSRKCLLCRRLLVTAAERRLRHHQGCELPVDEQLWQSLIQWRKAKAQEKSVPAFVIFTDATLRSIAERSPATDYDLLAVPGVGKRKLDLYGDEIVKLITSHNLC